MEREALIQRISIYTRVGFLAFSALINLIIPDHDSNTFASPTLVTDYENLPDRLVIFLFGGLLRWDAEHFFHIARHGYTYETNLAFFPLFPTALNYGALFLCNTTGLRFKSSFLLVSVLLNTALFMKSSVILYRLTKIIFKNEQFAFNCVLFYCFSPATIFFMAPYSESMFAFCTLNGMLSYAKNDMKRASVWFCVSTCVRSNGIINAGFIAHYFFSRIIYTCKTYKSFKFLVEYFKVITNMMFCVAMIFLPFLIFQIDGYYRFCSKGHFHFPFELVRYAERNELLMPGDRPIWCAHKIPMPYSYVQSTYWNVGFLKYYTLKQIPNFCLAFPIVVIILGSCVKFLYKHKNLFIEADEVYIEKKTNDGLPRHTFVYIVHIVFLTLFCVLNINVQVTTRMLASSSPVLYWIASTKFLVKDSQLPPNLDYIKTNVFDWKGKYHPSSYNIISYFISYAIVGTILFSNNLPWT